MNITTCVLKKNCSFRQLSKYAVGWLVMPIGLAIADSTVFTGVASASLAVNKSFTPISVTTYQPSRLSIDLFNSNATSANSVSITDNLPAGLQVATPANITNTCGGTITATPGTGSVSLTSGTIPAAASGIPSSCQVSVDVVSTTPNSYVNSIPAGAIQSSQGTNPLAANATLIISPSVPLTGSKTFSPGNLHGNGSASTMTIVLNNANSYALLNTAFTDNFPTGLKLTASPNPTTTCGGVVTATPGSSAVSLSGGTIPTTGSCNVTVQVESSTPNAVQNSNLTNSIPASGVTTSQGITNSSAIQGSVLVQTGAAIAKSFSPATIQAGQTSLLKLTLQNFNSTAITPASITDNMPANLTVTGGIVSNTCGGTPSFTATQLQLSGGTIPAAPAGAGSGSCDITVNVTSSQTGTYANSIPAGNFNGVNYSAVSANLQVKGPVSLSKAFSPGTIVQGGQSNLTITLSNATSSPASITSFTDNLTTMGTGFTVAASPAASTTCGGTVNATPSSTSITKTDGTIPANGSCTIVLPVLAAINAPAGGRTNTVPANGLQTNLGNNTTSVTASLTIQRAVTVSKAFFPGILSVNGVARLTINVNRAANAPALTGINLTDNLPTGHTINTVANVANTCGGSVSAPSAGTAITLAGGALAGGSSANSCQISVDIKVPSTTGSATNTIPPNSLVTAQGATYDQAATATLSRTNSYLTLNKGFSPTSISLGGSSTLTLLILNNNPSAVNLTNVALTDLFPTGMTIASVPSASFTGSGCSGATITAPAGSNQVSMSGALINVNSICTLSVKVTSNFAGNLTNELPIGSAISNEGATNTNKPSATLTLLGVSDLQVLAKDDGITEIAPGGTTTYTVRVKNNGPNNVAGATFTDIAPQGMTINSWSCTPTSGSSCNVGSGTGDVNTQLTLLNQGEATFTINATIDANASGTITNVATITTSPSVTDPDGTNNTAQDTDIIKPNHPNVLLVKRITAINGGTATVGGDSLAGYIDAPTDSYDDNNITIATQPTPTDPPKDTDKWPPLNSFMLGGINGGNVKPGDELEYTIYFLSTGDTTANNVLICDRIPENATFIPTAFNSFATKNTTGLPTSDRGIIWQNNGATESLTNISDGDTAEYLSPGVDPTIKYPGIKCDGSNTNGVVVVNLGNLPNAIAPGIPTSSYGFIRFRGRIK